MDIARIRESCKKPIKIVVRLKTIETTLSTYSYTRISNIFTDGPEYDFQVGTFEFSILNVNDGNRLLPPTVSILIHRFGEKAIKRSLILGGVPARHNSEIESFILDAFEAAGMELTWS